MKLAAAVRAFGDEGAVEATQTVLRTLARIAARRESDPELREELVQEACLRLLRCAKERLRFETDAGAGAFLKTIVRNLWIDAERQRTRECTGLELDGRSGRGLDRDETEDEYRVLLRNTLTLAKEKARTMRGTSGQAFLADVEQLIAVHVHETETIGSLAARRSMATPIAGALAPIRVLTPQEITP